LSATVRIRVHIVSDGEPWTCWNCQCWSLILSRSVARGLLSSAACQRQHKTHGCGGSFSRIIGDNADRTGMSTSVCEAEEREWGQCREGGGGLGICDRNESPGSPELRQGSHVLGPDPTWMHEFDTSGNQAQPHVLVPDTVGEPV
jgi:hypothetical protein